MTDSGPTGPRKALDGAGRAPAAHPLSVAGSEGAADTRDRKPAQTGGEHSDGPYQARRTVPGDERRHAAGPPPTAGHPDPGTAPR